MATCEPRLRTAAVESPLLSNGHGGFGERSGETGRWQHRNRAPGRLSENTAPAGQAPRLVIEWTADLSQPTTSPPAQD